MLMVCLRRICALVPGIACRLGCACTEQDIELIENSHACWKTGRWKAGVRSPKGQGRAHLIAFRSVVENHVQNDLHKD